LLLLLLLLLLGLLKCKKSSATSFAGPACGKTYNYVSEVDKHSGSDAPDRVSLLII